MPSRSRSVEDAIAGEDSRPAAAIEATAAATRRADGRGTWNRDMTGSELEDHRGELPLSWFIGIGAGQVEPEGCARWYYDPPTRHSEQPAGLGAPPACA